MIDRVCAHPACSNVLVRRAKEKPYLFKRRICCSTSCAKSVARGAFPVAVPERNCEQCGATLRRRSDETSTQLRDRKFCSLACLGASRRKPAQSKPCAECGLPMFSRRGESTPDWNRRQFCSHSCASRGRTRTTLGPLPESKPCESCKTTMRRREGERSNRWQARRFCSRNCQYVPGAVQRVATPKPPQGPVEEKACALCGAVFQRLPRATWSAKKWAEKKFCSTTCASRSRLTPENRARTAARKPPARKPAPAPVLTVAELRPDPAALLPDPDVVDMDRKRRAALAMLDAGAEPADVAVEVGVSIAQVNRWERA